MMFFSDVFPIGLSIPLKNAWKMLEDVKKCHQKRSVKLCKKMFKIHGVKNTEKIDCVKESKSNFRWHYVSKSTS